MPRFLSLHRSSGLSKEEFARNGSEIVNLFDAGSEDMLVREFERVGFP